MPYFSFILMWSVGCQKFQIYRALVKVFERMCVLLMIVIFMLKNQ